MFTQLKRTEEGRRIKILAHCVRPQKYPYSVQVVEFYKYNGLPVDNFIKFFRTLKEAEAYFQVCFKDLTTGARIEKAEAILRRIKGKIYSCDGAHDSDFPLPCWIKAERKVRRWLDRHIPRKSVERRDWMDCYL